MDNVPDQPTAWESESVAGGQESESSTGWEAGSVAGSIENAREKLGLLHGWLDLAIQKEKERMASKQERFNVLMRQENNIRKQLEEDIARYTDEIRELEQQLPLAKEEAVELQEQIEMYKQKEYELKVLFQHLKAQKEQIQTRISLAKNDSKREEVQKVQQRNLAELKQFEELLRLRITPQSEDRNKFEFTCIHEREWDRVYYFILDVPEGKEFSVSECQPPLEKLDELVARLNKDRDVYKFIGRMRREFTLHAANGKSTDGT